MSTTVKSDILRKIPSIKWCHFVLRECRSLRRKLGPLRRLFRGEHSISKWLYFLGSEEIQSLLCLLHHCGGVDAPGQAFLCVDPQEFAVTRDLSGTGSSPEEKPSGQPWARVASAMLFCYAAEESVPPPREISSVFQKENIFYFNLWRPVFVWRAGFCRLSKRVWKWKWLLVPGAMPITGYLKGGDTIRLLHSHSDACLTIPSAEQGEEQQKSVTRTSDILHLTVQGTSTLHIWFCEDLVIFFFINFIF